MFNIIGKSIRNKLMMITGLSTMVVVGTALFGFWHAWLNTNAFEATIKGSVTNEVTALVMVSEFKKQVQEWKDTLLRGSDPAKLDKYWGNFLHQENTVEKLGNKLSQSLQDNDAKDLVEQFISAHKTMGQNYRKGLAAFKAGGFVSHAGDVAVAGMDRAPTKLLEKAARLITEHTHAVIRSSISKARRDIELSIGFMLAAIVIAFLCFLWFVQKFIIKPSQQVREDLAQLANGDFTQAITRTSHDEIGQIAESAQQLQHQLGETIHHLSNASSQIADSSRQLTTVVEHTSQGVSQQRTQTDMVATAINEMVATVQEVTRNASRAADSAYSADQEARTGKQVLNKTTGAINALASDVEKAARVIHKLEEHSKAIGSVLDVIRDIAEQTNLLALNAAIEAARAGEQGRGFAVVADEVRTLAQRTQQSTSEIQQMIEQLQDGTGNAVSVMAESQKRATTTVEHASQAGEALETIVNAIAAISDMNTQIATAAEEQSAVAEEIGRNITAISQAAEQSAQSVDQTTRSSEELATLANQLQQVAGRFQI